MGTRTNPNELIDVEISVVKSYPAGADFDSLFKNGQKGAMWAPILVTIGLGFSLVEFFCCTYKCSWLPTALCLYGAFMLQMMTLFLFMSDDFWYVCRKRLSSYLFCCRLFSCLSFFFLSPYSVFLFQKQLYSGLCAWCFRFIIIGSGDSVHDFSDVGMYDTKTAPD